MILQLTPGQTSHAPPPRIGVSMGNSTKTNTRVSVGELGSPVGRLKLLECLDLAELDLKMFYQT